MAGKNRTRASSGKVPARREETEAAYRRRFHQLMQKCLEQLGRQPSPEELADWLIRTKRPQLEESSWRQVRAATIFGLGELDADPSLAATIEAAVARLRSTPPAKIAEAPPRTSQQKAKRFRPGDLERIIHRVLATRSPNGRELTDCLTAGNITGLRFCEWPHAELRPSNVPGFQWELKVRNGKSDDIRSHGEFRTLRFEELGPRTVSVITRWIANAREAEAAGTYRTLNATLQALMLRVTTDLFPTRDTHPTLGTTRHEAIARWKCHYVDPAAGPQERLQGLAVVAALCGHASDATATVHYGRPRRGEGRSSLFPVPAADPTEVARVRKRLQQDWARLASKQPTPSRRP
jgi:hypothetical protein